MRTSSKVSRFSLLSVMVFMVATIASAAFIAQVGGGPPTITVSGVELGPAGVTCGVENVCGRVSWTATIPSGTVVSGWDVELKVTKANGQVETSNKTINEAKARSADMSAFFQTSSDPVSYSAKVVARYSSSAGSTKNANF